MSNEKDIFTPEEIRIFEKTQRIRDQELDKLVNSADRGKVSTEFMSTLLDGMDKQILNKSKVAIASKSNDISEDNSSMMADLLKKISEKREVNIRDSVVPAMDDSNIPVVVLPGELSIGLNELNPVDFMAKDNKDIEG